MSRLVIGLDAGGTKLLAGAVNESGELLYRMVHPWPLNPTRGDVLAIVRDAVADARAAVGADARAGDAVAAIGLGLPATMDLASGTVAGCRHLPIVGFNCAAWLADETGLPVLQDNDATLALLAEARQGAARGSSDALMLTI